MRHLVSLWFLAVIYTLNALRHKLLGNTKTSNPTRFSRFEDIACLRQHALDITNISLTITSDYGSLRLLPRFGSHNHHFNIFILYVPSSQAVPNLNNRVQELDSIHHSILGELCSIFCFVGSVFRTSFH